MYSNLTRVGWSPKTILDIGAYKGNWTRETSMVFPNAKFTLIEPNEYIELKPFGSAVIQTIVGKETSTTNWYSNLSTGDSIYKENTRHYESIVPISRTITTLDTLFPNQSFDFIKIDCQGAELDILSGGKTLLEKTDVLLLECPFAGVYNMNAPVFLDYINMTNELGFSPIDITELHRANEVLCQIDILFLRKTSPLWNSIQRNMTR